jgi:hypothetical protein
MSQNLFEDELFKLGVAEVLRRVDRRGKTPDNPLPVPRVTPPPLRKQEK